jgi:threonine dehydrogenase-like Zn-dependent dehydrogenase
MTLTTICGTDLHILKGDVATCEPGRILGHEGVGVVEEVGAAVTMFKPGDRVLISCITACGKCVYCRKLMYSHCTNGGWILGNKIDGTQAQFVRIPYGPTRPLTALTGHCQTKFYTACLGAGTRSSFTVFAHQSPPRSARLEAENCLYLFALTVPASLKGMKLI